jgi:hypothetical protein
LKPTRKTVDKNKRSRDKDDTATGMAEQLAATTKKVKTASTKPKRSRDTEDNITLENEQPGPAKKAKTMATKSQKALEVPLAQSPGRRSARKKSQTPKVTQKRKRRTKAEMEADAAKAEEDRQQKEKLTKETNLAMEQMNISEDINRKATAALTIRKFNDLERDSQSDGEEFIGYNDVLGSEDGLDSDGEPVQVDDAIKKSLKVS